MELIIANAAILTLATPIRAQSQATTEISLEPASYTAKKLGEEFNVTVNIRNVTASQELVTVQFRVTYDKTLLEAKDVTEGLFLQQFNNAAEAPHTFFINFTEEDPLYGSNVLVGILLLPNATGQWANFPEGDGTLATITFRTKYRPIEPMPPATCLLSLTDTILFDENINEIPHVTTGATYEAQALPLPKLKIQPSEYEATLLGEVFNMSVNIDNIDSDWRLVCAQFRIRYDADVLKAIDANEGTFMQQFQNSAEAPYTFFIRFIEDDPLYGPNVLVGILLMPNATGQWMNFPEGNGTLATITFEAIKQTSEPQPPVTSILAIDGDWTSLFDDNVTEIPHTLANATYRIQPLSFSYEPSTPLAGQSVFFNTTSANHTVTYSWDFGDGTKLNATEPTTGHVYASPGNYVVALTCIADNLTSDTATQAITVMPNNKPSPIDVTIDVGSIHFKGETAQFSVLTASNGETINVTRMEASMYYGSSLIADLASSVRQVATGYYTIAYDVPADAQPGTYTLVVQVEYYNAEGTSLKSYQISPTLTAWGTPIAHITDIKNGIATVSNGIANLSLNLTAINATITGLIRDNQGILLAQIDTVAGSLTAKLDTINATITEIKGNTVTLSTTLGEVKTELDGIQSIDTTTLYAATILSAIAVILALAILIFVRKK